MVLVTLISSLPSVNRSPSGADATPPPPPPQRPIPRPRYYWRWTIAIKNIHGASIMVSWTSIKSSTAVSRSASPVMGVRPIPPHPNPTPGPRPLPHALGPTRDGIGLRTLSVGGGVGSRSTLAHAPTRARVPPRGRSRTVQQGRRHRCHRYGTILLGGGVCVHRV